MQNPNWIRTVVASFILAILLRVGFHIPIFDTFVALGIIYVWQVVSVELRPGLTIVQGWARRMGNVLVGFVIFIALRLIAMRWLGIYPTDTWDEVGFSGGFYWILWGRDPASIILWEMLFAFIAGGIAASWANKKARALIGFVFLLSFIMLTVELAYPKWSGTWPTRQSIDDALAKQGVASRITSALPTGGTQTPSVAGTQAPTTIVCGEGFQELPENTAQVVITIPPTGAEDKCWTPWLTRPRSARNFLSDPRGNIWIRKSYADKSEAEMEDSPLIRQIEQHFITAVRYQNRGEVPVKVIITF